MGSIWTALGNRLETAWKRPTKPNSKRPKDGEIIDEEKSVRWNREEVVRLHHFRKLNIRSSKLYDVPYISFS